MKMSEFDLDGRRGGGLVTEPALGATPREKPPGPRGPLSELGGRDGRRERRAQDTDSDSDPDDGRQMEMERDLEGCPGPRMTRPVSAKHGVRSRPVVFNSTPSGAKDNNYNNNSSNGGVIPSGSNNIRPKSAKYKDRNPLHQTEAKSDLILSRPKSAKHGRRARTKQNGDVPQENGHQRDGYHGEPGAVAKEEDGVQMASSRPLYRPKSAGVRKRGQENHVVSNGLPDTTPQNTSSLVKDTRRQRPKSAAAPSSRFRRPARVTSGPGHDDDEYDSACELDIETLVLDDKDGCITFDEGAGRNSSVISGAASDGEYDSGGIGSSYGNGRSAPTPFNSNIDRRIPYHHNHRHKTPSNQINIPQQSERRLGNSRTHNIRPGSPFYEEELDFDIDGNGSSVCSDSPNSNNGGMLNVHNHGGRRRLKSTPGDISFQDGIGSGAPYREGEFQHVARNVGERVVEKYRQRACTDTDVLKPPGLKNAEAAIKDKLAVRNVKNSRRKSLPAQIPRKLRPLLARGMPLEMEPYPDTVPEDSKGMSEVHKRVRSKSTLQAPSLLVSDESDVSCASSPVVPRRNSFNQSDPLLQATLANKPMEGDTKRRLRPVKPLQIEVPESDDALSVGSESLPSPPSDSAFLSLPTSPGTLTQPSVGSHRPFEPGRYRFSSDSGVGSRKNSLAGGPVPGDDVTNMAAGGAASDDAKAMAALAARRDDILANTPPRRGSDVRGGLMPLGGIPSKKPLCQTRSAPDSAVMGHS